MSWPVCALPVSEQRVICMSPAAASLMACDLWKTSGWLCEEAAGHETSITLSVECFMVEYVAVYRADTKPKL